MLERIILAEYKNNLRDTGLPLLYISLQFFCCIGDLGNFFWKEVMLQKIVLRD